MALFSIQNGNVKKIPPIKVGLERDVQKVFEENLNEILNITLLASEYSTSFGGRIDSIGIDNNGSPVIIEYKRRQNDNVINQGLSYLRWLLDHKADFEKIIIRYILDNKSLKSEKVDWSSPRVICVAESYNKFDLDTADLLPINIELLKFRFYQSNILLVEPETQQKIRISASKVFKAGKQEKIIKEKIKYSVEGHLEKAKTEQLKSIFKKLRENILKLDESIFEDPKKLYIAYKLTTNFADIELRSKDVKIYLNIPSGELDDPRGIARDLTKPKKIGHWGNGDYEVRLKQEEEVGHVFELIKQSYTYNK